MHLAYYGSCLIDKLCDESWLKAESTRWHDWQCGGWWELDVDEYLVQPLAPMMISKKTTPQEGEGGKGSS